jgi:hypothetical protein
MGTICGAAAAVERRVNKLMRRKERILLARTGVEKIGRVYLLEVEEEEECLGFWKGVLEDRREAWEYDEECESRRVVKTSRSEILMKRRTKVTRSRKING